MPSNFEVMIEEYLSSKRGKEKLAEILSEEIKRIAYETVEADAEAAANNAVEEAMQNFEIDADNIKGLDDAVQDIVKGMTFSVDVKG